MAQLPNAFGTWWWCPCHCAKAILLAMLGRTQDRSSALAAAQLRPAVWPLCLPRQVQNQKEEMLNKAIQAADCAKRAS